MYNNLRVEYSTLFLLNFRLKMFKNSICYDILEWNKGGKR